MKNVLFSKKGILCVGIVALCATTGIFLSVADWQKGPHIKITSFSNKDGMHYKVTLDNEALDEQTIVKHKRDAEHIVSLPDVLRNGEGVHNVKVEIQQPQDGAAYPAKVLDLLVEVDVSNGKYGLSGKVNDPFAKLQIENGKDVTKLTSDWAGLFSSPLQKLNDDTLEIAVSDKSFATDANRWAGRIEVLGGGGPSLSDIQDLYGKAMKQMAEDLSSVMAYQTAIVGMFFDAKIQLDTQRKHMELRALAHKDYHPSEMMCRVGTFMRSVAVTEHNGVTNKYALNRMMMETYAGFRGSASSGGVKNDSRSKQESYIEKYCDSKDHNGGTSAMCPLSSPTASEQDRMNKDIDYSRTLASKLTLDVDYDDENIGDDNDLTNDEADILALAKNLYFPNVFLLPGHESMEKDLRAHFESRSYASKMNVAHSSFLNIVGMKSRAKAGQETVATDTSPDPAVFGTGSPDENGGGDITTEISSRDTPPSLDEDSGWAYMKALLKEFGVADENGSGSELDEIDSILGERPSYYAQMEILTKKIYQNQGFYTNLYDKPANVKRISASLDAIGLMNYRDRYDSQLRQEMLVSQILEQALQKHAEDVSASILQEIQKPQNVYRSGGT